jgi:hypothetical protein
MVHLLLSAVQAGITLIVEQRVQGQRKYIDVEHRASKALRLANWRKMTQPGEI